MTSILIRMISLIYENLRVERKSSDYINLVEMYHLKTNGIFLPDTNNLEFRV